MADIDRVQAAVTLIYRRVLDDPALAPYFAGVDLVRIAKHQRAFLAAAVAGSRAYSGRDLRAAHAALRLGDAEVDLMISYAVAAPREVGVSQAGIESALDHLEQARGLVVNPHPAGAPD